MLSSILVVASILIFCISMMYFYMFLTEQAKFMQFWGMSWIIYSVSIIFLIGYINTGNEYFLQIRKVLDMFNLLTLLFGTYTFVHIRIPTYWYRFSIYLLLLSAICIYYKFNLLSFYLPISVYQLVLSGFILANIIRLWKIPRTEKYFAAIILVLWGLCKSSFSIMEIFVNSFNTMLLCEIMLSNVLNFCLLTIYISQGKRENELSENMYKTVVENSNEVLFYYKIYPYSAFEYVSPSIEKITGYSVNSFYDDPHQFIHMAVGNHREAMTEIFDNKMPYDGMIVVELYKKKEGTFWGEFNLSVINNENNVPVAIECTLRDITRIKTAEMEQVKMTRSRNNLLSYISHELRTPVTSIAGYLTALNDGIMTSEEEQLEAINIITQKTLTLKKLVDDLDQLSKLETHKFTFDFQAYSVIEVTEMLIDRNVNDAINSGFDVNISYDKNNLGDHYVIIDIDRINQVLSNLVSNAIKYSPIESTSMDLSLIVDDTQENFVVTLKDYGIGIKAKDVPHIFDRFYRAGQNDKGEIVAEGRGLGLTLCTEIIDAHQGKIYVNSVYGEGSTFTFFVPLYKED